MPYGRRSTMKPSIASRFCGACTCIIVTFVVIQLIGFSDSKPYGLSGGQQTIRLCSRSLSDALYLICQGRGYNSPFSYSNEDETRTTSTNGPGLVDECCLQSCNIKQLELYCKPPNDDSTSQDGMDESVKIVNLPDSLETKQLDDVKLETLKRKNHIRPKMRRYQNFKIKKLHKYLKYINGNWAFVKNITNSRELCTKHCRYRHQRLKRRREKILDNMLVSRIRKFQVGTTSPEPSNMIVMFPSKTYYGLETSPHGFDPPEKFRPKQLLLTKVPLDHRFLQILEKNEEDG